jgi:nicotinic acetylcholine receptor
MFAKSSVFLVVLATIGISLTGADRFLDKLAVDLTKDYVNFINPGNITVTIGMSLMGARFDRATRVLTSRGNKYYSWIDSRLAWNPKNYGRISEVSLPVTKLWTPDIMLYNSYENAEVREDVRVVVQSRGNVVWVPPTTYTTKCSQSDSRQFNCLLKFGSWTMNAAVLNLETGNDQMDLTRYYASDDFDVISARSSVNTVVYDCCPEPYSTYEINIQIRLK